MSLKYGLNVKKAAAPPVRKTLLGDEDEEDDDEQDDQNGAEDITSFGGKSTAKAVLSSKSSLNSTNRPPPARRRDVEDRQDLSSQQAAQTKVKAAEDIDASIFDYDSFHDAKTSVTDAKKAAARQDAIDRKPKYINNLLDAAARRKQDQQVAREKFLQKEREAEGDEFADKEKFVTGAYKEQQAETRRLEEEEKAKAEAEEKRRRGLGGGMQGFYRGMIDQREEQHLEALEAAEKMEQNGGDGVDGVRSAEGKVEKSDAELAAELKAKGVNVHINDEGQITDKRELLSAGLNISASNKSNDSRGGADHLKSSAQRSAQSAFAASKNANRDAQRERQSKMMEEQLAARAKRAREEEEEERQKAETAAKSTKTAADVSDAKARYLARKAAKEKEAGGGG